MGLDFIVLSKWSSDKRRVSIRETNPQKEISRKRWTPRQSKESVIIITIIIMRIKLKPLKKN